MDINIFKEITGQGKELVILHGWGGCNHKHMQPIVDQLAGRYKIMNFDLPGQGHSDWHPDILDMNAIVNQLLVSLPEQAIYLGWSFGGQLAMSIAANYPERVNRLIGIGTTPRFITNDHWPGIPEPGFKSSFTSGIKQKGWQSFMTEWFSAEFADFEPKPAAYHKLVSWLTEDYPRVNLEILFKGIDISDATDLRKSFQTIRCPIDLIFGERDDSILNESHKKIKALNSNVNVHTISKARHMPFWTHSQEFNQILNHIL